MITIHGLGLPLIPFRYAQACRFFIGGNEMHHILSAAVLFIAGIFLVAKGGDRFIDSASWIARAAGIPAFIIGATIVSIATTLPEITVSVMAAMQGSTELAAGNIIGANILDLTLILPLCSLASGKPLPVAPSAITFDLPACLLIILIGILPLLIREKAGRIQGLLLLASYAAYLMVIL